MNGGSVEGFGSDGVLCTGSERGGLGCKALGLGMLSGLGQDRDREEMDG